MNTGCKVRRDSVMDAFVNHLTVTGRILPGCVPGSEYKRMEWEYIGQVALLHGLLTGPQIEKIIKTQSEKGLLFGEIALHLGFLNETQLQILLEAQPLRSCLEMLEHLALSGRLDLSSGVLAITEFISRGGIPQKQAPGGAALS